MNYIKKFNEDLAGYRSSQLGGLGTYSTPTKSRDRVEVFDPSTGKSLGFVDWDEETGTGIRISNDLTIGNKPDKSNKPDRSNKSNTNTKFPVRMYYSRKLELILKKLEDLNSYAAFEMLWLLDYKNKYDNVLRITSVDVSNRRDCFDIRIDYGKVNTIKIRKFLRTYFKETLSPVEVEKFIKEYNAAVGGGVVQGTPIAVGEFKYNPKDVRSTFISLVTKTYPYGHEKEVLQFLPKLNSDRFENYYIIVGDSQTPETMFTSHLDTADNIQSDTKLFSSMSEENEFIFTDGSSILGADDKAGVAIMLYMISENVPGLYYFFIGEERGAVGSTRVARAFDELPYLRNVKRCVSFDRRDVRSVITRQLGRECCSTEFAEALCSEYNSNGLRLSPDGTGVFTDSASFLENIPECTNISVGYYSEHTSYERQNITFLAKLAEASVKVNWNSLPITRKAGLNPEILAKYGALVKEIKKTPFPCDVTVVGEGRKGNAVIKIDFSDGEIDEAYETLTMVQYLLNKYKIPQTFTIDLDFIKIDLPKDSYYAKGYGYGSGSSYNSWAKNW